MLMIQALPEECDAVPFLKHVLKRPFPQLNLCLVVSLSFCCPLLFFYYIKGMVCPLTFSPTELIYLLLSFKDRSTAIP